MSSLIEALKAFFQAVALLLSVFRDEKLRKEGERRVLQESLEESLDQQGEAHEIDLKVVRNELSADDLERMRRYQRTSE